MQQHQDKQASPYGEEYFRRGFGAIAYAVFISYVRYGPSGPKAWFQAKFLNKTTLGTQLVAGAAPGVAAQSTSTPLLGAGGKLTGYAVTTQPSGATTLHGGGAG